MDTIIRVLLVTDDFQGENGGPNGGYLKWQDQAMSAATGENAREFHLGEFVQVLESTVWLGFEVQLTKATRSQAGTGGMNAAALKADRGADVIGFRFDQPFTVDNQNRTLSDYDIILFFPIKYGNPNAALAPEAEAISEFMEQGGGFFATGDHNNLGGELAGLIPRVRSMRRWWPGGAGPNGEPAAPPATGPQRHDTTRPGLNNITNFEDQSDDVPQPIKPKFYKAGIASVGGYPAFKKLPHPLLCSPEGIVNWLPDHMHEGWCEVPDQLATRMFNLNNTALREYPDYTPVGAPQGYVPAPLAPEVVATGEVLDGVTSPAIEPIHFGGIEPAQGKTFGVIGAWDGHRVDKGRVVVDSTWHHFFDINLSGDRYLEDNGLTGDELQKTRGFYIPDGNGGFKPNDAYRKIMWYYRNIVYWLIPANRKESIWWKALSQVAKYPQFNEELSDMRTAEAHKELLIGHYLYFGQLAEKYFSEARGACASYEVKKFLYKPKIPWWEWPMDLIDIWDPMAIKRTTRFTSQDQWIGAAGMSLQPEVIHRLTLGAAIVTAAAIQPMFNEDVESAKVQKAIQTAWTNIHDHAVGEFIIALRTSFDLLQKVEQLMTDRAPIRANPKTQKEERNHTQSKSKAKRPSNRKTGNKPSATR